MKLSYEVTKVVPIDEERSQVTVNILTSHVINGYGGGPIQFDVPDEELEAKIEERVEWKFTNLTGLPAKGEGSPLKDVEAKLEKAEAVRECKRKAKAEWIRQEEVERAGREAEAARIEVELREAHRREEERREAERGKPSLTDEAAELEHEITDPPVEPGVE